MDIGAHTWVIPEGHLPPGSAPDDPGLQSHETMCVLNASERDAKVEVTIYFADREPAGPFRFTVRAERTAHVRFDDLDDPERLPRGTDFASVIRSDVPVVVQHTRLDSRAAENALMTTMAFAADVTSVAS
ncbi:MAG TPA: sensory rhodopsin transducer [Actinomycetota bacterium]|nr:sensory rhodopsin transducer [Actinomycetota bacterium]